MGRHIRTMIETGTTAIDDLTNLIPIRAPYLVPLLRNHNIRERMAHLPKLRRGRLSHHLDRNHKNKPATFIFHTRTSMADHHQSLNNSHLCRRPHREDDLNLVCSSAIVLSHLHHLKVITSRIGSLKKHLQLQLQAPAPSMTAARSSIRKIPQSRTATIHASMRS